MKIKKRKQSELAAKIMAYGATAAGLLAVAQPVEAAVVYSGTQNLPLSCCSNTPQNIDLDNDGNNDFFFSAEDLSDGFMHNIFTINSNEFIQSDGDRQSGHGDAANLSLNYLIQANIPAASLYWATWSSTVVAASGPSSGSFTNTTGYLGVRFHSEACQGSNWHYGWIQFRNDGNDDSTIIDWAYEDTCNAPVRAGSLEAVQVPTLSQWGMLIMAGLLSGAAVYRLRKDKKEA